VRRALWRAATVALLAAAVAAGTASAAPLHVAHVVRSAPVNGTIEGTVTDAVTSAPLVGIEVCAYELTGEAEPVCTLTHAAGAYALLVPAGEYFVEFFSPFGSNLNYVTIFQGGATSFGEAVLNPLTVTSGSTDAGVNAAMHQGGHIAGHVDTAEHPEIAIEGIEVCAERRGEEGFGCAMTGAGGAYKINALPAGEYIVHFGEPPESELDFVPEFYEGSLTRAGAKLVTVTLGATTSGIGALLSLGGHIAGHVASAEHPEVAIEGVEVCAESRGEEGFGCATTGAGGAYKINALPAGEYIVEFRPPFESGLDYVRQFYEGSLTRAGAKFVTVALGATTSGIGALLSLGGDIEGKLTAAPAGEPLAGARACALVSEKKAAACTFTNGKGEYALRGLPAGTYWMGFEALGYQWQYYPSGKTFTFALPVRLGAGTRVGLPTTQLLPIGYVPPPPVEPPHLPPPPPPTGSPGGGVAGANVHTPGILFSSTRLRSSHAHVSVSVSCAGAPCSGTIRLTMRVAYRARRHGHTVTLHRTVVLAQGTYSLAAGAHATISLRETAAGVAHLAHAGRHPVVAQLLGSVGGGVASSLSVRVS
jgi:hypothetical protein